MQWPDTPIPLAPFYYTFWACILAIAIIVAVWLPKLQEHRVNVTLVVLGALIFLLAYLWR